MSKKVFHVVFRLAKKETGHVLHILESQDNLCFTSTLPHQIGQDYRDLSLRCSAEWKMEVLRLLHHLQITLDIDILDQTESDV